MVVNSSTKRTGRTVCQKHSVRRVMCSRSFAEQKWQSCVLSQWGFYLLETTCSGPTGSEVLRQLKRVELAMGVLHRPKIQRPRHCSILKKAYAAISERKIRSCA